MLGHERRSKVLAKLTNARCELEDALNLSIPAARDDPVVIPEPIRNKLSAMIDDLNGVLRQIEGSQGWANLRQTAGLSHAPVSLAPRVARLTFPDQQQDLESQRIPDY
jgi:hypothetical protein